MVQQQASQKVMKIKQFSDESESFTILTEERGHVYAEL